MAIKRKDYYEALGISRSATDQEIKKAYYRLAREHHPDLHPETEKLRHTQRMQEVNEAYAVLSSAENRAKYDQFGEDWEKGPPPGREEPPPYAGPSGASEEAFSDFFRNVFRQQGSEGGAEPASSAELDIEATLEISIEEAIRGVEKKFSLMTTGLCMNCHGTGRVNKSFCPVCGGLGEVQRQREATTKIPPGLHSGSRIRIKGHGNDGAGIHGDLYLNIRLAPSPNFKVQGLNLERELSLMPWQAALGAEISVETPEGAVKMRIPKKTHTGTLLRLAGRGLGPSAARGDLFVKVVLDIPNSLSPTAEALYKKLEEDARG